MEKNTISYFVASNNRKILEEFLETAKIKAASYNISVQEFLLTQGDSVEPGKLQIELD